MTDVYRNQRQALASRSWRKHQETKKVRAICAWCKRKEKIDGKWVDLLLPYDSIKQQITHGICPKCNEKFMRGE